MLWANLFVTTIVADSIAGENAIIRMNARRIYLATFHSMCNRFRPLDLFWCSENPINLIRNALMKISKTFALAAAAITILSAAVVHASTYCDSQCDQAGKYAYNQVMKNYPPLPGSEQCATVPDPYKAQCIASIDSQRASVLAAANSAYGTAYYSCLQTCHY